MVIRAWQRAALAVLGLTIATALATAAGAATVTVTPDRTEVFENESFNVDFVYSDEVRDQPGFDALLDDFQIIANTRSSNLLSVNGRFSYEHSYSLTLMPRRTGELVIPPIRFDDIESEPVRISVKSAPAEDQLESLGDLYLEVTLEPDEGYVQGQYIFTQRLYHRGWLAGGKLSPPSFGDSDAVVRQVDQAKRYSMFRDGERYQIYEQSYLVFPQSSGTLTAQATDFTGQLREPGRPPRLKRVSAAAVSVNVLGVPDGVASDEFLPASRLTLEEEWPTDATFEEGQPVTRVLRITAEGQMAAQLRAVDVPDIDGLRVYADQPKRDDVFAQNGVTGTIEQSLALVPQRAGTLTLPAVAVRWWDVNARVARVAELPARTLEVAAARGGAEPLTAGQPAAAPSGAADSGSAAQNPAQNPSPSPAPLSWPYWPWLTVLFAVLWLATLGVLSRRVYGGRTRAKPASFGPAPDKRRLFSRRNAVKQACDAADPAQATRAMIDWAQLIWPDAPPRSLGDIAAHLDDPAASEVSRLAATRYGRAREWVEPDRLWRAVAHIKPFSGARRTGEQPALAPL